MSRIGKRPIPLPPKVAVSIAGQEVTVKGPKGELKRLLPNTVEVVQQENNLIVNRVNESRPVDIAPPAGISLAVEDASGKKVPQGTFIVVEGIDKEVVGNLAAKIRAVRPPEVYKGKGIRYFGEFVRRKAGKTGKK